MKHLFLACLCSTVFLNLTAQTPSGITPTEKSNLKFNLNEDGSHYFQVTFLNQVWLRYSQLNPGTLVDNQPYASMTDIGLRRTRVQLFGEVADHVFLYFQFGQNNFNAQTNYGGNRKNTAFFHDALCEYQVGKGKLLRLGGGLTIANGLSRFSQPSIGTIMTMDVPVFAQATVDQIDLFSRKLSLYARGQLGHLDYRFVFSDPFTINSSGATPPAPGANAMFAAKGHTHQGQAYVMWQFFEHEQMNTPYMTGTYLGAKKVFNLSAGVQYQPKATWTKSGNDTLYHNMLLACVESFLDMPLKKEKGTAISAYLGYFFTNYGPGYLRYNGLMNPATSSNLPNPVAGVTGSVYGNSYPMFGTGQVLYAQAGFLAPKSFLGKGKGQLMPYASMSMAKYDALGKKPCEVFNAGVNWLIQGHKAKITLNFENRPTFYESNGGVASGKRMSAGVIQYQIFI